MTRKLKRKSVHRKGLHRKTKRIYGGNLEDFVYFEKTLNFDKKHKAGEIQCEGPFNYIIGMTQDIINYNREIICEDIRVRNKRLTQLNKLYEIHRANFKRNPNDISLKNITMILRLMIIEMESLYDECFGGPARLQIQGSSKQYPIYGSFVFRTVNSIKEYLKKYPHDVGRFEKFKTLWKKYLEKGIDTFSKEVTLEEVKDAM
jgi:hypothetical protein